MNAEDLRKQQDMVATFIGVYCRKNHGRDEQDLCEQCSNLLDYALRRLDRCPFDPKPRCKDCRVHCYAEPYRSRIREVMEFSGMYFVKRGRIDWLWRYFARR